jgi:hypothetical protein
VRRLPPKRQCELLYQLYFSGVNTLTAAIDETMFREQSKRWWDSSSILLTQGPEGLPSDLPSFPALMFQVFTLALPSLPASYEGPLEELKFAPTQSFDDLSSEYAECGEAIAKLLAGEKPTLVAVQRSLLRSQHLINIGDLMQGWNQSGHSVKSENSISLVLNTAADSTRLGLPYQWDYILNLNFLHLVNQRNFWMRCG